MVRIDDYPGDTTPTTYDTSTTDSITSITFSDTVTYLYSNCYSDYDEIYKLAMDACYLHDLELEEWNCRKHQAQLQLNRVKYKNVIPKQVFRMHRRPFNKN